MPRLQLVGLALRRADVPLAISALTSWKPPRFEGGKD